MDFYEPHPWGVLPCGNASAAERPRAARLGDVIGTVPESASQEIIAFCDAPSLARLAAASTGLYVTINGSNDVWRALVAALAPLYQDASTKHVVEYQGTWRATAAWLHVQLQQLRGRCLKMSAEAATSMRSPCCRAFEGRPWHSDSMFQSWLCTLMPPDFKRLDRATARKSGLVGTPSAWCASPMFRDVPRESGLSVAEFKQRFEQPNTPVILTDVAKRWRLFELLGGDLANLRTRTDDILRGGAGSGARFRCESILMSLPGYADYAAQQRDERAAYLFDADFNDGPFRDGLWEVPKCFAVDDLFAALGNKRPNYRWLIAGPARAGSSFHIDPNFTNAWNACLTGRKRWLMFPPNVVPPGVYPSEDMADVTTPVSLTEWLLNYYEEARRLHHNVGYECVVEPGETIFVPCGWWHCVINLEPSVAVTQNYVSDSNLGKVLKFLKTMPNSISGIGEEDATDAAALARRRAGFYKEFADKVKAYRPDLAPAVDATLDELHDMERARSEARRRPRMADALHLGPTKPPQPSAEDSPVDAPADEAAGFTFDF